MRATVPRTSTGGLASAVEGWTGARFCDCAAVDTASVLDSTTTRDSCEDPFGSDCEINDILEYNSPTTGSPWQPPTIEYESGVPDADLRDDDGSVTDGDQDEVVLDYGDTGRLGQRAAVNLTWDYTADDSRFDYALDGTGEFAFSSVTWTHVAESRNAVSIDRYLTSHYWSGIQARTIEDGRRSIPDPCGLFLPFLIPPSPLCPVCSYAPGAWSYIEPLCATDNPFVEIWFPTMVLDASAFYDWQTPEDLADVGGFWVNASEPDVWREHGTLHAALATDGTQVYTLLSAKAGGGYTRTDVNASGPTWRSDFGAVLSQRRDTLYVVGGLDANGSPTMELWGYDVANNAWTNTSLSKQGFGPERVLAAAYSPSEDALLVLDRPAQGTDVRLWRLPLPFTTDTAQWVTSWQSQGTYTQFGMALDTDGEHYNVVCDQGANAGHVVLRLDADDGSVDEYVDHAGTLEQTVLLGHEEGVSVLALDANGAPYPLFHHTFSAASGSTPDLCFE